MQGFFPRDERQSLLVASTTVKTRQTVDMGGNGDCGFRAIAAGILDNVLSFKEINEQSLCTVLSAHFLYFPRHRSSFTTSSPRTTPRDWLLSMLKQIPRAELVQAMAFTLRQIAVDEIVEVSTDPMNPRNDDYIGALIQNNEHTSPKMMRQSKTWIDESSIKALSNKLGLPITVEVKVPGKPIRMKPRTYNLALQDAKTNPGVVIQLEAGHYQPSLLNPSEFNSNTYKNDVAPKPVFQSQEVENDMDHILKIVQASEARIIAEFDQIHNGLTNMVNAGELNKEKLLALYIEGMETSDYLRGRIRHADLETGSEHFSQAITNARGLPAQPTDEAHDDYVVKALVHALARAWSVGDIKAGDVFSQIYAQTERSYGP
jgi:hypothetical protein